MNKIKFSDVIFISVVLAFDICVSAFNILAFDSDTGGFAATLAFLIFICAAIPVSFALGKKKVLLFFVFFFAIGAIVNAIAAIPMLGDKIPAFVSAIFIAPYMGVADILSLENAAVIVAVIFDTVYSVLALTFSYALPHRKNK